MQTSQQNTHPGGNGGSNTITIPATIMQDPHFMDVRALLLRIISGLASRSGPEANECT
jgi:hypothetical protein